MLERFTHLCLRVRALIRRRELDRDLEEEMSFHLALREASHRAAGVSADDARSAARRQFGNVTTLKEACRDMWRFVSLENLEQDLRFAVRTLRRQPGFTAMAVISLALGIGANSAVFTIINDLLLKTIPVQDPANLVSMGTAEGGGVMGGISGSLDIFPYDLYKRIEARQDVFQGICAYGSFPIVINVRPGDAGGPQGKAIGTLVSGTFFNVLGVGTILGRTIDSTDADAPGHQPVAVISYDYWQQNFSGDRAAIGRSLILNGTLFTVIGVAPPGFYGVTLDSMPPDMWLPLTMQEQATRRPTLIGPNGAYWLHMMGRLQPGVGVAAAQEWLDLHLRQYMADSEGPGLTAARRQEIDRSFIKLIPGGRGVSNLRGEYTEPLQILLGIVGLVLLIACANLANFFLAKMAAREREITTRLALGAGPFRIARQLLTETLVLSFLGGALGLLFASWGTRALIRFVVAGATRTPFNPNPDLRVLAFTFGITLFTGLLLGLAPAWRAARLNLSAGLQAGSRGISGAGSHSGRFSFSRILVTTQVALSLVLLVGAGLFARTLRNLEQQPLGFNQFNLLEADVDLRLAGYKPEQLNAFYERLLASLNSLPGVVSVSLSEVAPMVGHSWTLLLSAPGHEAEKPENPLSSINSVTPGYFQTIGTALIEGRGIEPTDTKGSLPVAVVNQTLASRFFPHGDAIGKHVLTGNGVTDRWEIVGIVQDSKYRNPRETAQSMLFLPLRQLSGEDLFAGCLLLRTKGDPQQMTVAFRQALAHIDSNIPLLKVTTLSSQISQSMAREILVSRLSTFFSLLALLLACIGLYGVMSYKVVRRANEIGVRMALGAERGAVLWLVFRETLLLLVIGNAIGVPATLAAARLVQSQLFGLSAFDPTIVVVAMITITVVTALAGYLPARRATKVDPLVALRYE